MQILHIYKFHKINKLQRNQKYYGESDKLHLNAFTTDIFLNIAVLVVLINFLHGLFIKSQQKSLRIQDVLNSLLIFKATLVKALQQEHKTIAYFLIFIFFTCKLQQNMISFIMQTGIPLHFKRIQACINRRALQKGKIQEQIKPSIFAL